MPVEFSGIVVEGNHEGRVFGFPTANLMVVHNLRPGIYAGHVEYLGQVFPSAIIVNPKKKSEIIEAHLLSFNQNLYGQEIKIVVKEFIRDWYIFQTLTEGQARIKKDLELISKKFK